MIDLSIYLLLEIKSMAKIYLIPWFPDNNAAWAMSFIGRKTDQAEEIISVSLSRCFKT